MINENKFNEDVKKYLSTMYDEDNIFWHENDLKLYKIYKDIEESDIPVLINIYNTNDDVFIKYYSAALLFKLKYPNSRSFLESLKKEKKVGGMVTLLLAAHKDR